MIRLRNREISSVQRLEKISTPLGSHQGAAVSALKNFLHSAEIVEAGEGLCYFIIFFILKARERHRLIKTALSILLNWKRMSQSSS